MSFRAIPRKRSCRSSNATCCRKQLVENGLSDRKIGFTPEAISEIIRSYAREAGLRNLEREIARVYRKIARSLTEGDTAPERITLEMLQRYLGPPKYFSEVAERTNEPGVATGLAWTPNGGDIIFIESTRMSGSEGADAYRFTRRRDEGIRAGGALVYPFPRRTVGYSQRLLRQVRYTRARARRAAIPKDGPSAGVTMTASIASLLTGRPVRAMSR